MGVSRRVIAVPRSLDAARRLDYGQANESDLVEEYVSDEEFRVLHTTGWLDEVNNSCDTLIDDYEDEKILSGPQLTHFLLITQRFSVHYEHEVFAKIQRSADLAQRFGTEVCFYF